MLLTYLDDEWALKRVPFLGLMRNAQLIREISKSFSQGAAAKFARFCECTTL